MLARACAGSVVIGACYVACLFAVTRPTDDRNDSRVIKKRCVASAVSCACAYVVARLHFDALPPDNTPAWERPHDPAHARAAAIAASAPRATAIALLTWMPASADLESRMAYADNRDKLKQALGGLDLCLTITDASELDEAIVSVACQAQLRDEAGDPKGVRRLGARHAHLRAGAGRS